MLTQYLANLSDKMYLTLTETAVLPTVIERAAIKVSLTPLELIQRCVTNVELREYLADTCRTVVQREGDIVGEYIKSSLERNDG